VICRAYLKKKGAAAVAKIAQRYVLLGRIARTV